MMVCHTLLLLCMVCLFPNLIGKCEARLLKKVEQIGDGAVKAYAYKKTTDGNGWITLCELQYNNTYNQIGWDSIEVQTNPDPKVQSDLEQAECAGELEGYVSYEAIYYHYYNNVKQWCKGREAICDEVNKFLDTHSDWLQKMINEKADRDPVWHQVNIFYNHIIGLVTGYKEGQTDLTKPLTLADFILMNFQTDLDDVVAALSGDVSSKVEGRTRCSAIIKLLPDYQDLLVGHNTWTSYVQMYRMVKKYDIPVHERAHSKKVVPGKTISFSGYPGVITSGDDFYATSSGLVAQETTIGNNNASLWQYVTPTGELFESVRSMIALRLAKDGRSWCKTFSGYNSGTYNNQWMIVDLKKFNKGEEPKEGTLWILEQIPSYIRYEDQTKTLVSQTYWPSYNVPFYVDIFDMSGNQQLVDQYGDWFSYNNTPRALIFQRDNSKVTDLDSLLSLLRSNNYKHDPYSKCNCTPPYSAENAIAARSDLNPKDGKYPFPALGHRPHGAIDAKVISPELAKDLKFVAICGPTTGNHLPPFRWDKSDFNNLPHEGQPNSFEKFTPYTPYWIGPFF